MQARPKLKSGKLAVGYPSRRDEVVLDCGGIRADSVLWDFSSDGGAVSTISMGRLIPNGAIVTKVILHEITSVTSGGSATLQVLAGATALTDAIAVASIATGVPALASSATAIPLAADSELKLAIAVAALTAGKLRMLVEYVLPTDL